MSLFPGGYSRTNIASSALFVSGNGTCIICEGGWCQDKAMVPLRNLCSRLFYSRTLDSWKVGQRGLFSRPASYKQPKVNSHFYY